MKNNVMFFSFLFVPWRGATLETRCVKLSANLAQRDPRNREGVVCMKTGM